MIKDVRLGLVCGIFILAGLSNFSGLSYARTSVESLAEVEKLFMEAKYERVVTESTKLIDSGSHGREELNYLKGLSLLQLNRFSEGRRTFEYMVERYPRGKRAFDGYIGVGDSYFMEGKFNDAVVAYNEALKVFPDHKNSAIVYYKLGNSYQKLGVNDKAREYHNKVGQTSPLSFESKMVSRNPPSSMQPSFPVSAPKEMLESDSGDFYYVQTGYFKTKVNADKLCEKLRKKGYESYVATVLKSNIAFYRVKVGHFESKAQAEAVERKLKVDGYKTKVCR